MRRQNTVGIDSAQNLPLSGIKPGIPTVDDTLPFFVNDSYERVLPGNRYGIVSRIIVNYYDFYGHNRLHSNSLKAGLKVFFFVICWYNQR